MYEYKPTWQCLLSAHAKYYKPKQRMFWYPGLVITMGTYDV